MYFKDEILTDLPRNKYYEDSKTYNYFNSIKVASYFNKLSGGIGTLYPPNSLNKEVINENLFMKLAPTSDDIWFWLMGVLNNTRVRIPFKHYAKLNYIPNTQDTALWKINDKGEKLFYVQLNNILKEYPEIINIIKKDQEFNEQLSGLLLNLNKKSHSINKSKNNNNEINAIDDEFEQLKEEHNKLKKEFLKLNKKYKKLNKKNK